MKRLGFIAACAASAALAALPAWAQTPPAKFPDRLIRIVVPFAVGGGVDSVARLLANQLHTQLGGVPVIVENRPGANGVLGGRAVQTAPADGHTLLFSAATHVLAREVLSAPPYDPQLETHKNCRNPKENQSSSKTMEKFLTSVCPGSRAFPPQYDNEK